MHLSGFVLDMADPAVRQCIRDAHDMHRCIMSGFLNEQTEDARCELGVLYRLIEDGDNVRLYVTSAVRPDWGRLSRGFIAVKDSPRDISGLLTTFKSGRRFSFDMLAMPSKKEPRPDKHSRRVFLQTEAERSEWLARKAEQNGFSILWHREDGQRKAYVWGRKDSGAAVHTGVRFRGELVITDEELFKKAYQTGIGAGRAYGMSMLMLSAPGW